MKIFFFQAKKKEAKKSLGHLRLCPKPRNALLVREKTNACFLTVGTDVLGCPKRTAAGAVPGRNYKLLPALATNSPPDCLLNASRHPPYDEKLLAYDITELSYL